jgi:hypothetical protein
VQRETKRKLVVGTAAALAVAGGGAAIGATQLDSPQAENQAVVSDAAKQLGVTPDALSSALKKALENRVDAAVAAGRLTQAEGDALKKRIEAGDVPLFAGPGFGFRHGRDGHFGGLEPAAAYLGETEAQLRTQLESGKTLAQVAGANGKSVEGLVNALVAAEKKELDAAVAAGRLTQAQADQMLASAKQRATDFVNGKLPPRPNGPGGPWHDDGFRGGPPPGGGASL